MRFVSLCLGKCLVPLHTKKLPPPPVFVQASCVDAAAGDRVGLFPNGRLLVGALLFYQSGVIVLPA